MTTTTRWRMLKAIATAFDAHDLEGIMVHFVADAVFEGLRGADAWGTRCALVPTRSARALPPASPDPYIRYKHDSHFADGDRGASEWTLSGTTAEGQRVEVRGCDLWTFRDGRVVKKHSHRSIRAAE